MPSIPASSVHVLPAASGESTPREDVARLKSLFLTTLNHEIRTPLSGLMGMTDLLLETVLTEEQLDFAKTARQCAEDLLRALNATLQYAALEAGELRLEMSEFNVRELVESAIDLHSAKAQAKGVRLFSTLGTRLPATLVGDGQHIKEILGYLLDNALKFTHQGMLQLAASYKEDMLKFTVRDTGVGMAAEQRDRIAQSFRKTDAGFTREDGGVGLGLMTANRLTELMQGRLLLESEPSRRSAFIVEIPVCTAEDIKQDPVRISHGALPMVLGVDDSPVGAAVLRHALKKYPITLQVAESGEQAVNMAAQHPYVMILMDLHMPGMNGWEAANTIRALPGYENVPIFALTSVGSDDAEEKCFERGLQGLIAKPIHPELLWKTIAGELKIDSANTPQSNL
jgi:CheY-like chemotaxis protein